jgi:hypothetical protein
MLHSRFAAVFVFAFGFAFASAALAQSEPDHVADARRLFFDGVAAEDRRDFAAAIAMYERVEKVAVSPQLLFNLGHCNEGLGRLLEARKRYAAARDLADERAVADVAAESRQRVERLDRMMPRVVLRAGPSAEGAVVVLDDRVLEKSSGSFELDPGPHRIVATKAGASARFELAFEAEMGAERVVTIELVVTAPEAPAKGVVAAPDVQPKSRVPMFVLGGIAAASAIGAVTTGAIGYAGREDYIDLNTHPTADNRDERESLRSRGDALYVTSAILIGTTVLAAGGALYFYLRDRPSRLSPRPAMLPPSRTRACR